MFYHVKIVTVHSFSLKFLSKSPFIVWCLELVAHLSQSLHFDNGQFIYFLFQLSNLSFMIPWRILSIKGSPMCVPDLVMAHTSNQKSHLMKQKKSNGVGLTYSCRFVFSSHPLIPVLSPGNTTDFPFIAHLAFPNQMDSLCSKVMHY